MEEDKKELINQIQASAVSKKKLTNRNLSPDKFMELIAGEFLHFKKCDRILKKLEKYMSSDEFIFGLDTKDFLRFVEIMLRNKHASLAFYTKLYEVSTKNELLRTYFEEKEDKIQDVVKQDIRIRNIVKELRARAKEKNEELVVYEERKDIIIENELSQDS